MGRPLATIAVGALAFAAPAAASEQSTLDPKTDTAREIAELWWIMLVVATVVTAVVLALLLLAVLRRQGRLSDRVARRLGGMGLVLLGGLALPLVVLALLYAYVLDTLVETAPGRIAPELTIVVTGRQWFWDVRYPDARVRTANEIHVPTGTPIEIRLRAEDVIHSFWAPELNRKVDAIPGYDNRMTFVVDEPGIVRGQCAEYCGTQHANMAFEVIAERPDDFRRWLQGQARPAEPPAARSSAERGMQVFFDQRCSACHRIAGTDATAEVGPDLTHLASRRSLAGNTIPNTRGDLGGWILDPQSLKPGNRMPGSELSGPELQALLDYLEGLR